MNWQVDMEILETRVRSLKADRSRLAMVTIPQQTGQDSISCAYRALAKAYQDELDDTYGRLGRVYMARNEVRQDPT